MYPTYSELCSAKKKDGWAAVYNKIFDSLDEDYKTFSKKQKRNTKIRCFFASYLRRLLLGNSSPSLIGQARSLSFSFFFFLIPFFAFVFASFSGWNIHSLEKELNYTFLSATGVLPHVLASVNNYISSINIGGFLVIGFIVLFITISSFFRNLDRTINTIWGKQRLRPYWGSLLSYFTAVCGVGLLIIIMTSLSESLQVVISTKLNGDKMLYPHIVNGICQFICYTIILYAIYKYFPQNKTGMNKLILAVSAIIGFLITILNVLSKTLMIFFSRTYTTYGVFAYIPIFLLFSFVIFVIILTGAYLLYYIQNQQNIRDVYFWEKSDQSILETIDLLSKTIIPHLQKDDIMSLRDFTEKNNIPYLNAVYALPEIEKQDDKINVKSINDDYIILYKRN